MASFRPKSAVPSLIVATGAICLILAAIAIVAVNADPDETWSGWAQAIGTFAAIMVGFVAVIWQQQKAEEARKEERQIFSAAFGIQLLPKLRKLRNDLEYTIEHITVAIEGRDDPKSSVSYDDDQGAYGHIKFIRENWQTLSQMEAPVVRALVSTSELYDIAHRYYHSEHDVEESFTDDDGNTWFTITFRNRDRAVHYRTAIVLALARVNVAIENLSIAQSGQPEIVVEVAAEDL